MMMECARDLTSCRLGSPRLTLEPLRLEYLAELAPLLADLALHRFTGGMPPAPGELRARVARQVRGRSPDGNEIWLNWVVRERSTSRAVGTMQATIYAEQNSRVAVLAWVIGSAHQGQGLGTEAARLMTSWLRRQGISCLRAYIHPKHDASMAVAAAIGLHPTKVIVSGERRWESAPTH